MMQYRGTNLEIAKKMQALLKDKRAGRGAGVSAAIILNGELIAECADGVRGSDMTPVSVDDLFNIGSITKVYCTAAIMKLVEMGKVDLDSPVVKYLPEFKMRDERYKDITIRMTLSHSSGIPGTRLHNAIADKWTGENIKEELLSFLGDSKLKAAPGVSSVYCNDGFDLAAMVIEELTGKKFIDFVRDEITTPAGATTTGEANVAIGDRRMMCCLGMKPEWMTCVGAGAIRSTVSDCARFGYIFIDPKDTIKKELLEETAKSQGVTFIKNDHSTPEFGLGWDTVCLKNPFADLGEHTLAKGGGTPQFSSYLIVSPEYKLSAAISGTIDCNVYFPDLLCELIALAMEELGTDVSPKPIEKPRYEAQMIPTSWYEKYGGIYYSFYGTFKTEIQEGKLCILRYEGSGKWADFPEMPPMQWSGERFFSEANHAIFETQNSTDYILSRVRADEPFAQKNGTYPEMSNGWKARLNKKYIVCNISPSEGAPSMLGITIEKAADDGVILFRYSDNPRAAVRPFALGRHKAIPAVSAGDDDTDMFLNLPYFASRDIYAPFITRKDGVEYLHNIGYLYVDGDSLPTLKTGIVSSPKAEENAVYRIKAGDRLIFKKPDGVNVYMLDENLSLVYASVMPMEMPLTCDGYILFANGSPMKFDIEVQKSV